MNATVKSLAPKAGQARRKKKPARLIFRPFDRVEQQLDDAVALAVTPRSQSKVVNHALLLGLPLLIERMRAGQITV